MGVMGGYGEQDVRSGFDNVTFHGHVMDMRPIYDETRIVLMPSKYESYGRIAVEAASRGIPSIVCPTPGLLEALDDAGIYAVSVDQFSTHLKRLQHWKAYKSASMKSSKRFETIQNNTFVELESLLTHLNGLAETGRLLRGW
jgi:glycosyltransferase involved in cell wall biosynthesis